MIIVESKKKKLSNLIKLYPNFEIIDVTSKSETPFVKFSPFYPHGNIPIPYSDGKTGKSVEGIWQGLKVFEQEGIDQSRFYIEDMKNIKRTSRSHGRVLGHQKGVLSNELLDYPAARKEIYLRTYAWVLDNLLQDLVSKLKEIAFKKDLILLDFETNIDIENYKKPLSHAGLIKRYLEKKFPELKEMRFTETMSYKDSNTVKTKKVKKDKKIEKVKNLETTEETSRIEELDQLALFNAPKSQNSSSIISKVWSFCNILKDDGVSYGDYLEQLTYLLFLKMADEYSKPPYNRDLPIATEYNWESLIGKKGAELEVHYTTLLRELGKGKGILGQIFIKSQNKIQDPAKLFKLIDMIDNEKWSTMDADIKGDIYEGLLEKNAEDTKSGAGQYFTPRALIRAMVECIRPEPMKTISDPACGTGGFFLAEYDFIVKNFELDKAQSKFLKFNTFRGNEIVASTRRLALMNLFLHNIGDIDSENSISSADSLIADSGERFDYVLANPPFGKKSSMTFTNEEGEQEKEDLTYNRQDFWATTSNKQLNFVQHIKTILKDTGKAAVVVPDNVLFEGGAGETVRKKLLETTDLHTILRLPTGIFYAQGVKANVIFFDSKPGAKDAWTKEVWYYDYRTNVHHTLKKNPLKLDDLKDFIDCYNPKNRNKRKETWDAEKNPEGRWRKITYEEIISRDKTSLDISWIKDKSLADLDNLPDPDVLADEIIENLEAGLESFKAIMVSLNNKKK